MCIILIFLQMKSDKYFSSLSYSICDGLNFFFSANTQKKICSIVKKKLYLSPILMKQSH